MNEENLVKIGRLALREEGQFWNAYYTLPDNMKGAMLIASINLNTVKKSVKHKEAFMSLMREIVSDIIEDTCGQRPQWRDPVPAADSERSGNS